MEATTTAPNAVRGEVTLPLPSGPLTVRFGMTVMRDVTKKTGKTLEEYMAYVGSDYLNAVPQLVACAVNRYAHPQDGGTLPFDEDAAALLIDSLPEAQGRALGDAIAEALAVTGGPLMGALLANVAAKNPQPAAPTQQEPTLTASSASGSSTSTSPSVS